MEWRTESMYEDIAVEYVKSIKGVEVFTDRHGVTSVTIPLRTFPGLVNPPVVNSSGANIVLACRKAICDRGLAERRRASNYLR